MSERNGPEAAGWTWAPRRVETGDGALHYVRGGVGAPVLFVHGTPTWSYEWRHALRALEPEYDVIALDHLGFGLSERPAAASYSPEAHASRFREAVAALVPEGRLSLVVHDFGGPIALDWALDHADRLSHVVIVNSWMWPLTEDESMARAAKLAGSRLSRFLYRRLNASLRMLMPSAYADRKRLTREIHEVYLARFPDADSRERVLFALAKSLAGSSGFHAGLWSRRHRLAGVPVTIIWGMGDGALKPALLARWEEAVPRARIHRMEDAGHWPHEEQPESFNRILRESLAERADVLQRADRDAGRS